MLDRGSGDVVDAAYSRIAARDWTGLAALLAEDVEWQVPLAPMPSSGLRGPADVIAFLSVPPPHASDVHIVPDWKLAVPSMVVVTGHHELCFAGDRTERVPFRHTWRLRDGHVVSFREALEPGRVVRALARRGTR